MAARAKKASASRAKKAPAPSLKKQGAVLAGKPLPSEAEIVKQIVGSRSVEGAAERPLPGELYEARWPITYGPPSGEKGEMLNLLRGQVFTLKGYPNDEKLVRLGYIQKVAKGSMPSGKPVACGKCGARFATERFRDRHGREVHEKNREKNPHLARLYARTQEILNQGHTRTFEQEQELAQLREAATAWEEQREARPFHEAASETPLYLERSAASVR